MKKQNLLKLAFTMLAMVFMTGVMAQQPWDGQTAVSKYNQSALQNDPASVTYTDKVTTGKKMPFWVWPSAAYNPDFVTTGFNANYPSVTEITTNVVSKFAWRTGVDFAGLAAVAGFANNYVEIGFTGTGNRLIEVTETPSSGLCPADPVYFGVNVIEEPSATIVGANTALGLKNVISSACVTSTHNVVIATTLPSTNEEYPYHFNVTYEVFNVNGLNGSGELPNAAGVFNAADLSVTDITASASVKILGQDGTSPSNSNPIILASGTDLVASNNYIVENNKVTVYRITYNNVNARISRKSDYIAARTGTWTATDYGNFSYYPTVAANTAKYIVSLPTPVTGPIYHIANNFAY